MLAAARERVLDVARSNGQHLPAPWEVWYCPRTQQLHVHRVLPSWVSTTCTAYAVGGRTLAPLLFDHPDVRAEELRASFLGRPALVLPGGPTGIQLDFCLPLGMATPGLVVTVRVQATRVGAGGWRRTRELGILQFGPPVGFTDTVRVRCCRASVDRVTILAGGFHAVLTCGDELTVVRTTGGEHVGTIRAAILGGGSMYGTFYTYGLGSDPCVWLRHAHSPVAVSFGYGRLPGGLCPRTSCAADTVHNRVAYQDLTGHVCLTHLAYFGKPPVTVLCPGVADMQLCFANEGRWVLVANQRAVRLYDAAAGSLSLKLEAGWPARSLHWVPHLQAVLVETSQRKLQLWKVEGGGEEARRRRRPPTTKLRLVGSGTLGPGIATVAASGSSLYLFVWADGCESEDEGGGCFRRVRERAAGPHPP